VTRDNADDQVGDLQRSLNRVERVTTPIGTKGGIIVATKDLREWIKYVDQKTVREEAAGAAVTDVDSSSVTSAAQEPSRAAQRIGLEKPRRRPESWDLARGNRSPAFNGSGAGKPESLPAVNAILGEEGVGEPRPKPRPESASKEHRLASRADKPIQSPRIKSTPCLHLLMTTFSPGELPSQIEAENDDLAALLQRIVNPELSLHETALVLDVCATTIRRYTNSGILPHFRRTGNHRRFYLKDVIEFARTYGDWGKEPDSES